MLSDYEWVSIFIEIATCRRLLRSTQGYRMRRVCIPRQACPFYFLPFFTFSYSDKRILFKVVRNSDYVNANWNVILECRRAHTFLIVSHSCVAPPQCCLSVSLLPRRASPLLRPPNLSVVDTTPSPLHPWARE